MTLQEMSKDYEVSAELLRCRMRELRAELKESPPEKKSRIKQRMAQLDPLLREMNTMTKLTRHYYERGYAREKKYTM